MFASAEPFFAVRFLGIIVIQSDPSGALRCVDRQKYAPDSYIIVKRAGELVNFDWDWDCIKRNVPVPQLIVVWR
jgi:hypothetical protein